MSRRHERLCAIIKEKTSEIINNIIDDFSEFFITITDISISSDYMNVTVSYSVLGDEEDKIKVAKLFKKNKSRLRFELGNNIAFRRVPIFKYEYDETIEKASKIENILNGLSING
jgi:ribosome-binding factor A